MSDHRAESGSEHPHSDEPAETPAGSGTTAPDSPEKRQAGSYSRDAEQDPSHAPPSESED
ncbi:MAG: hypothetical protein QOH15_2470 [Gaiellales bacterium]|jgi:hypothetical protein|nr:hypothetical protein [Gaiellales bacterium]